jgi:hypothetical protein
MIKDRTITNKTDPRGLSSPRRRALPAQGADLRKPDLDGLSRDPARARRARLCYAVEVYVADWRVGRRAGLERNIRMLDSKPDLVFAFRDGQSRGTGHTIAEARRRNIPVGVVTEHRQAEESRHRFADSWLVPGDGGCRRRRGRMGTVARARSGRATRKCRPIGIQGRR